jgi:hypothetical protein
MSRNIAVYTLANWLFVKTPPNRDINSPEFEEWCKKTENLWEFEAPLGSESAIRKYWSGPAYDLALPLLTSIYDDGFHRACEWVSEDLDRLSIELGKLEAHWSTLSIDSEIRNDLIGRMSSFLSAIRIAKACKGTVTIT